MPDPGVTTPSPLPTPKLASDYTLSERINAATRPTHSQLNRLIIDRLPLALPPHSSNPSAYLIGLIHIVSIYSAFEELWQTMLDAQLLPTALDDLQSLDACDPERPLIDCDTQSASYQHKPKVCTRIHSLLTHLRLPGLLRTDRLRSDIRVLSGITEEEIDERLREASHSGSLGQFVAHIEHSVEANPHVLLAYAWVLYMALFSGGRFLRHSLYAAGPLFWGQSPIPSPFTDRPNPFMAPSNLECKSSKSQKMRDCGRKAASSEDLTSSQAQPSCQRSRLSRSDNNISALPVPSPGLEFFNFIGTEDGEDIKLEFKKRISEVEILLTSGEKDDIVGEAQDIFKFMLELVHQLDGICHTFGSQREESDSSEESSGSVVKHTMPTASDDSSTDSIAEVINIKNIKHKTTDRHALGIINSRDSVVLNHDRIRKRNTNISNKDSLALPDIDINPPIRTMAIAFKGQHDRKKSNFASLAEPLEKMVRWGGFEMVGRRLSTQVKRLSPVKPERRAVFGKRIVLLVVMVIGVVIFWWMILRGFALLE